MLSLKNRLKLSGNPLIKLAKIYYLYFLAIIAYIILSMYFYVLLYWTTRAYWESGDPYFFYHTLLYTQLMTIILMFINTIFTFLFAVYYVKGGSYSGIGLMSIIGLLYAVYLVPYDVSLIIILMAVAKLREMMELGEFSEMFRVTNLLTISEIPLALAGIFAIAILVLLFVFLAILINRFKIDDAASAILLMILVIIFSILNAYVTEIYIKAIINLIYLISLASFIYKFSESLISLGNLYDYAEKNPNIIESAITDLRNAQKTVNLIEFAKKKNIPYPWVKRKLFEKIQKGEIKGMLKDYEYHPM